MSAILHNTCSHNVCHPIESFQYISHVVGITLHQLIDMKSLDIVQLYTDIALLHTVIELRYLDKHCRTLYSYIT